MLQTRCCHFVPNPSERAPTSRATKTGRYHADARWQVVLVGRCDLNGEPIGPAQVSSAFQRSGVPGLTSLTGPFALEILDYARNQTTLVQSPLGQRPVYVLAGADYLAWGTEIAGLIPRLHRRVFDGDAVREMLNYRWCAGSRSLVHGVRQLLPGTAASFPVGESSTSVAVQDPRFRPGPLGTLEGWADDLVKALTGELECALAGAARPTVLLSGGVDSSLLAALSAQIRPDVIAVTPTWTSQRWNDAELPRARQVAEHLGIEHRIIVLSGDDILGALADMSRILEHPPKDHWALALLATFRHLRDDTDLVIHGGGADMLLGARNRIRIARARRWARLRRSLPRKVREVLAASLPLDRSRLGDMRAILEEDPLRELCQMGRVDLDRALYHRHRSVFGDAGPDPGLAERFQSPEGNLYETRLRMSLYTWGRAHTQEVTRAADDVGFRVAFPFVGTQTLDLAFRLPPLRAQDRKGLRKPVVRAAHARYFPGDWGHWPKLGFPTPILEWHQGCMSNWMAERLGPGSVARRLFGDGLDDFRAERDYEHLLTLACLEDFARRFDVALPNAST